MSFSIEEGCAALRHRVTELRLLVENADIAQLRERPDDASLSVQERIVGLCKYETDYLRPALAVLLGQEMRRLPVYDLAKRAVAGGYGAYTLDTLFVQWAETRNVSIAKIEALDESFLGMRGEMPDCAISIGELLEEWVSHEAEQMAAITAQMKD